MTIPTHVRKVALCQNNGGLSSANQRWAPLFDVSLGYGAVFIFRQATIMDLYGWVLYVLHLLGGHLQFFDRPAQMNTLICYTPETHISPSPLGIEFVPRVPHPAVKEHYELVPQNFFTRPWTSTLKCDSNSDRDGEVLGALDIFQDPIIYHITINVSIVFMAAISLLVSHETLLLNIHR